MQLLILLSLLAVVSSTQSQTQDKPACVKQRAGEFWPAEANSSPKALHELARSGQLEVCSCKLWRYKWESLTVSVKALQESNIKSKQAQADRAPVSQPKN